VGRDGVIRYFGRELQLERAVHRRVPDGARAIVQQAVDGTVRIIHRTGAGDRLCAWHEAPSRPAVLRGPQRTAADIAAARRPSRNHPWRQWIQQSVLRANLARAARGQF